MDYGVVITSGAMPWQIFQQRPDGTAAICLEGCYSLNRISEDVPIQFYQHEAAGKEVYARVVREDSGEDVVPWQPCALSPPDRWSVTFPAVPAGGLYRLETRMTYHDWDGLSVTRGDMVHHIGVGDVFVVAGQSNACGRALTPICDPPELGVHLFRYNGRWDLASHPLDEATGAIYFGNYSNHNPGHSPFLHFAKRLKQELGWPIGLVMTPYGGSPLSWWNPNENGALTQNMLNMLEGAQARPKAMLWYQGEAEGFVDGDGNYRRRFLEFLAAVREKLEQPDFPVFTVQLGRCCSRDTQTLNRAWGKVRQAQREAARHPGVYVVPANDLTVYDTAHLTPESNLRLAERLANAALGGLYGQPVAWRPPEAARAVRVLPKRIRLEFENVVNSLDAFDVPTSLLPIDVEDDAGFISLKDHYMERAAIVVTLEREPGAGAVVHGAWRSIPGAVIPQDLARQPMLSFYGLPIEEGAHAE
ncbi:MAG: sialate O-acetylesterase [Clostridiales bacterium]|jgi:hypothetical protein|nr:sialate O-acetylesterase [Clostridiales bacterium]